MPEQQSDAPFVPGISPHPAPPHWRLHSTAQQTVSSWTPSRPFGHVEALYSANDTHVVELALSIYMSHRRKTFQGIAASLKIIECIRLTPTSHKKCRHQKLETAFLLRFLGGTTSSTYCISCGHVRSNLEWWGANNVRRNAGSIYCVDTFCGA